MSDTARTVITLLDGDSLAGALQIVRLDCPADLDLEALRTQWKQQVGHTYAGAMARLQRAGYDRATDETASYTFTPMIGFVRWLIRHHDCVALKEEHYLFNFFK